MGDIGLMFKGLIDSAKGALGYKTDPAVVAESAVPSLPQSVQPDARGAGYTSTGGRRFTKMKGKKTRKSHKKARKTRKH